jgi:invasion protein IalB
MHRLLIPFLVIACVCSAAASAETYRIKPPEMVLPEGLKPGELRRVIHPFPNWILICDENLKERKRICNISQTVINNDGDMVFSWSLAATEEGKPMMILRAPVLQGGKPRIELEFRKDEKPYPVEADACDAQICVFYVPAGPRFRSAISESRPIRVTIIHSAADAQISFVAPLEGLAEALAAIE